MSTEVHLQHQGHAVIVKLEPDASGDRLASITISPRSGEVMTSKTIRQLPLGALFAEARKLKEDAERPEYLPDLPKRIQHTDWSLARVAAHYAAHVRKGNRQPLQAIAEQFGGAPYTWANRIQEARKRGLLTPTVKGRVSGELTDYARTLIGDLR